MFHLRASLKRRRSPPLLLAAMVLIFFYVYVPLSSGYLQPDRAMRVVAQKPQVTVTFYTNPSNAGLITFSGSTTSSTYSNGQSGSFIGDATYTATANLPQPFLDWRFDKWEYGCMHGEIFVSNTYINPTSVHVSPYGGEGWLKAVYSAKIIFQTYPSNMGSITYDGSKYTNDNSTWEVRLPPDYGNTRKIVANVPKGYRFVNWGHTGSISIANSTSSSTTATISGPGIITANFERDQFHITFQQTGIGGDYAEPVLTVDGTPYKLGQLPKTFTWDSGTLHRFTWWSPLSVSSGKRYSWVSTSGLSTARSDNITATSTGDITGNYQTQFYLTVKSERGTPSGSGWYDAGQPASFSVSPSEVSVGTGIRYNVTGYSGDASGSGDSGTTVMDRPKTIVFNWIMQYQVSIDPNGGAVKVDQTPITSPYQYWWKPGSNHTIEAVSPYEIGSNNTRKFFTQWADGSTQNPRTITVNRPETATAEWKIQYLLKINTPTYEKTAERIGSPEGEGWYDQGKNASFKITSPWQRERTRYVLLINATRRVLMDGPKEMETKWKKQYYLEIRVNPPNAAEVKGNGPDDPWYDENSSATIQPPSPSQKDYQIRYLLKYFKLDDAFRLGNSLTVPMDKPHSVEVVYWLNKLINVQIGQQTYQASLTTNSSLTFVEVLPSKYRLSFTVEGASGTRGAAEVVVPTQLIQVSNSRISNIMVLIDGTVREAKIVSEGDYVKITIDYPHSTRRLDVYYNSYVVEVHVLSQLGILNIPMANIKLESDDGYISLSNVTDSTGRFKARLPPLSYRIEASSWSGSLSQTLTLNGDRIQGLRLIYSDDIVITFVVAGVVTGSLVVRRIHGYRFNVGQLVLYKGELLVVQSCRRDGKRKVYDLRRP